MLEHILLLMLGIGMIVISSIAKLGIKILDKPKTMKRIENADEITP